MSIGPPGRSIPTCRQYPAQAKGASGRNVRPSLTGLRPGPRPVPRPSSRSQPPYEDRSPARNSDTAALGPPRLGSSWLTTTPLTSVFVPADEQPAAPARTSSAASAVIRSLNAFSATLPFSFAVDLEDGGQFRPHSPHCASRGRIDMANRDQSDG